MTTRRPFDALLPVLVLAVAPACWASGVREHKSGTIQTDAVGQYIWTANADSHSVSRIDAVSRRAAEYPLGACTPQGLSVRDDGAEVWVACPNEDLVLVLDHGTLIFDGPVDEGLARYEQLLAGAPPV